MTDEQILKIVKSTPKIKALVEEKVEKKIEYNFVFKPNNIEEYYHDWIIDHDKIGDYVGRSCKVVDGHMLGEESGLWIVFEDGFETGVYKEDAVDETLERIGE